MTELTRRMYDRATELRSVDQAVGILPENGQFRTLADILRSYSGLEDPKSILVDGLMKRNPSARRDSLNWKVSNWLGGKTNTVIKEDAFLLCRILGLSLEKSDEFLKQVTREGIHWRDPEEIVWGYAIVQNLDYGQTDALLAKVRTGGKRSSPEPAPGSFTGDVREKLQPMLYRSPEELFWMKWRPSCRTRWPA